MSKIRVRLARYDHPNGQRIRAGYIFTREWTTVDVTPSQRKEIVSDPALETAK